MARGVASSAGPLPRPSPTPRHPRPGSRSFARDRGIAGRSVRAKGTQLVGGFARLIQYRDRGEERSHADDGESFTRAYRDQATPEGRLFDGDATIGDDERRALVRHIRETTIPEPGREANGRAFYRMIISPEDAPWC